MKKKILFTSFTGFSNPSIGGPTRIIYDLLKNLDYTKYEPYFLSYDMFKKYSSGEELDLNQDKNIYAKRNLGYKLYDKINLYRDIVTSDFYLKYHYHKKDKYFYNFTDNFRDFEIIHSHDSLSAYYFLNLKKPKKILTIHSKGTQVSEMKESNLKSNYFKDFMLELSQREMDAFFNFDLITFPSNAAKEIFLQDINFKDTQSERIKIIYNGIDLDKIRNINVNNVLNKYNIQKNKFDITLLNVAQHVKPKNIDLIIRSIKTLRDEFNIRALLVNIGEGYLTEDYKSLIEANLLSEQVKFLGMISNDDVIRLMKSLDIFIQASERVIFDLVVLEALASGIKVLVSNEGGNREIIKDGVNGFLISELSERSVAKDIAKYQTAIIVRTNSLDEKYSIASMTNNFEELFGQS
ncbi:MAG TPA: glycosyltransferase family 4 protein [Ignavibacteriaceae bacterium]|mgnify:CR=1 FL=1|nr:glycosyltransferase family 4 protein [Ignavibacteriaceae bacterium]